MGGAAGSMGGATVKSTGVPADPNRRPYREVPHPSGMARVSTAFSVAKDYPSAYYELFKTHGNYVRIAAPFNGFFCFHPDGITHVVKEHPERYIKSQYYKTFHEILGNGLVTAEGEEWKTQRRELAPSFKPGRIRRYQEVISRHTHGMLDKWIENGNKPIDIGASLLETTLGILGETLLGERLSTSHEAIGEALIECLDFSIKRMVNPVRIPEIVPTPARKKFREATAEINAITRDMIADAKRRQDGLLYEMSLNSDETQVISQVKTLILAGHETTALGLTWAVHALCQRPDVWNLMREEVDSVLGGSDPDFTTYQKLNYCSAVFKETLRLHTPIPAVVKQTVCEDSIAGYEIPVGQSVFISPYVTHRHPEFWDDPESFRPERWENPPAKHAYLPFLAGPRSCIGEHFAMVEAVTMLALIAQRVELLSDGPDTAVQKPIATLRFDKPIHRRAKAR